MKAPLFAQGNYDDYFSKASQNQSWCSHLYALKECRVYASGRYKYKSGGIVSGGVNLDSLRSLDNIRASAQFW